MWILGLKGLKGKRFTVPIYTPGWSDTMWTKVL